LLALSFTEGLHGSFEQKGDRMSEEKRKPVESEAIRDFLKQEYNALISLYIHYELIETYC